MTQLRIGAGVLKGAGPVVVVSPHLDDGVMSCGGLIAGLARRRPVSVVTVFAGWPRDGALCAWDRAAGFASGERAIAARRAEDRAALAALGAHPCWLPFRDSQYGPSPRVAAIAHRLAALPSMRSEDAIVLFPLGLFHSDHRLVRDAALALLRRLPRHNRWLAYEDALYRRLPGLRDGALDRLRRAGLALQPARLTANADDRYRKARAVACYASQLRALATPGRLGHADAFAGEGYWLLVGKPGTDHVFGSVDRAAGAPCCAPCPPGRKGTGPPPLLPLRRAPHRPDLQPPRLFARQGRDGFRATGGGWPIPGGKGGGPAPFRAGGHVRNRLPADRGAHRCSI